MLNFLPSCLRRHKKKLLFLGGVVGGIAFFNSYLKRKFIEWETQRVADMSDQFKKSQHFESTMMTCDSTFTAFTRKIREVVLREVEVEEVVNELKQVKSASEKVSLWEQLKVLVFTQVIGEMYAQCLLCILIRVQMCILSGYFFATRSTNANTSDQLQKYMSHIEEFMLNGISKLLVQVRQACARKLKHFALDRPMLLQDIEDIIIDIQADISISDSKVLPDISSLLLSPSSHNATDDKFLNEISSETKDILECDDFKDVLDACVNCGVSFIMDQMSECYAFLSNNGDEFVNLNEYATYLAKIIPTIDNLYRQHDPSDEAGLAHKLVQLEKLNNFAANIYEAFSQKC